MTLPKLLSHYNFAKSNHSKTMVAQHDFENTPNIHLVEFLSDNNCNVQEEQLKLREGSS